MKVAADGAGLRVENLGAPAKVEAKLLVLEEKNWAGMQGAPFDALWGKTRRAYSDIPQHGHDHIILGDGPRNLSGGKVRLRFSSQSNQAPEHITTVRPGSHARSREHCHRRLRQRDHP